jgi:hypothetical protein
VSILPKKTKLQIILFLLFIGVLAISLGLIGAVVLSYPNIDLNGEIDPAVINGLLTGFAIIFGFASSEINEIRAETVERFFLATPSMVFFIFAVAKYIGDIFANGYPNYWTLLSIAEGIFFTVFYLFVILVAKQLYDELPAKISVHFER